MLIPTPVSIIVGSAGQDGYYLSRFLLQKGHEVIGLNRKNVTRNLIFSMAPIDINDRKQIIELLSYYQPAEVYYLAAYHRAAEVCEQDLFTELTNSYLINVDGLLNFLDGIERYSPRTRLFYAASSHVFGDPSEVPQTEETPFRPICCYGVTKAAGVEICRLYRRSKNLFVSTGILYNHESPRRNIQFVTRKIVHAAVKIKQGMDKSLILGDLTVKMDWGAAEDYVVAMNQILELEAPDDFIVASGEQHTIKEFTDIAFNELGLHSSDYIKIDPSIMSKNKRQQPLIGNANKLKQQTKWIPAYSFDKLVKHMVLSELESTKKLTNYGDRGADTSTSNKLHDTLLLIPTYNESDNIIQLIEQILELNLGIDILIVDDNSSDGTGEIADQISIQHSNIFVIHRPDKGIGGAHLTGVNYAYEKEYQVLITMDADFSHSPKDIPLFMEQGKHCEVVVGTRFKRKDSLKEWSLYRKALTNLGHFLTQTLLRLPYDASGGFRLYRLDKINKSYFDKITSCNYEFFFESLTLLHINGFRIHEVPINLPKRVYGHSKMRAIHMFIGLYRLLRLSFILLLTRKRLIKADFSNQRFNAETARLEWDSYWSNKNTQVERATYDVIAKFYRYQFIKPNLSRFIKKYFKQEASLLHAGCGGGEVDINVVKYANVTALDISPAAIDRYNRLHGKRCKSIIGNIFHMQVADESFDGVYNLGVMEHFQEQEVIDVLREMSRVIKPSGKLVLFWPPVYGLSVIALHLIHFVLNSILKRNVKLHPDEPSKIRSKQQLLRWLDLAGLELEEFSFSIRDAFTYAVVVASKRQAKSFETPTRQTSSPKSITNKIYV